ncbi:PilZ domain-containing protein [Desulfobacter curvatus]|uniref:PilZ domain-containing protein n=1 Tax=Desulfobacter curvatus TaxID=2290 RepID=UPI00036652A8|nr:PilZ domain-containing protein [Desulfobacter curvatus]
MDNRREIRRSIESIILPFLGTRETDHEPFQFLIIDISENGLKIAIPRWLVGRDILKQDELINMHIPFRLGAAEYKHGRVMWKKYYDTVPGDTYGISMENRISPYDPVYISLETLKIDIDFQEFDSLEDISIKLLKDMYLLKKGILVYLKHLLPYFTRITEYRGEEYKQLKDIFLADIIKRVGQNYEKLFALYEETRKASCSLDKISKSIDLEELRELVESEINIEILKTTFKSESILPYLNAIKLLEQKQYADYNMIVMLYMKELEYT